MFEVIDADNDVAYTALTLSEAYDWIQEVRRTQQASPHTETTRHTIRKA